MNAQGDAQDAMVTEASGDTSQSTQQTTQATQEASQQDGSIIDAHLWGYLLPCNPKLHRIDFHKLRKTYSIGRNAESGQNDIIFPGPKISKLQKYMSHVPVLTSRVVVFNQAITTVKLLGTEEKIVARRSPSMIPRAMAPG